MLILPYYFTLLQETTAVDRYEGISVSCIFTWGFPSCKLSITTLSRQTMRRMKLKAQAQAMVSSRK
jgi:hypothetical protein